MALEEWKVDAIKRRDEFRQEHDSDCMVCGGNGSDVHEICRGNSRVLSYRMREAWLLLCRGCHEKMDNYALWPMEHQYIVKMIKDPVHYDREMLNGLNYKSRNSYITEVDLAIQMDKTIAKMTSLKIWKP